MNVTDLPGLRWHKITAEPAGDPGLAPFRSYHDLFGDGSLINTMRQQYPGLVILPAHDPGAAGRLAQATGQAPTLASA